MKIYTIMRHVILMTSLLLVQGVATVARQRLQPAALRWQGGYEISADQLRRLDVAACFSQEPLPDAVFARMQGKSYPEGCTISRASLRYLRVLHVDGRGRVKMGEVVCHQAIAADLLAIFRELYRQRYPIESVRLIDDFGADDERSMRANNTSAFCYRRVKGSAKLSAHARGMAIDFNTRYNPYYRRRSNGTIVVQPSDGLRYCDRAASFPYKITRGDLLYRLCRAHGFTWGGDWRTVKDWQHFEASPAARARKG